MKIALFVFVAVVVRFYYNACSIDLLVKCLTGVVKSSAQAQMREICKYFDLTDLKRGCAK